MCSQLQLFWEGCVVFPQVARFQGGAREAKASALRDYLDLPVAADTGFCVGCVDGYVLNM